MRYINSSPTDDDWNSTTFQSTTDQTRFYGVSYIVSKCNKSCSSEVGARTIAAAGLVPGDRRIFIVTIFCPTDHALVHLVWFWEFHLFPNSVIRTIFHKYLSHVLQEDVGISSA